MKLTTRQVRYLIELVEEDLEEVKTLFKDDPEQVKQDTIDFVKGTLKTLWEATVEVEVTK